MVAASTIILEYVCPTLGCVMGNIMFSAPYKSVREAVARGHLGDLNPTPWAFMLGNTIGWVAYSYLYNNYFLFVANCPGMLFSVWLNLCASKLQYQEHYSRELRKSLVGFLEESKSQELRRSSVAKVVEGADSNTEEETSHWQSATDMGALILQITSQTTPAPAPHETIVLGMVIFWTSVISFVALTHFSIRTDGLIIGIFVNINLFFFYGAPLSSIFTVLKDRDSSSIHRWTMITNTVNGAFWTAYGIAVMDPFIFVPNGLGSLLGVVQIVLVALFPRLNVANDEPQKTKETGINDGFTDGTVIPEGEKPTENDLGEGKSATSQGDSVGSPFPVDTSTQV